MVNFRIRLPATFFITFQQPLAACGRAEGITRVEATFAPLPSVSCGLSGGAGCYCTLVDGGVGETRFRAKTPTKLRKRKTSAIFHHSITNGKQELEIVVLWAKNIGRKVRLSSYLWDSPPKSVHSA